MFRHNPVDDMSFPGCIKDVRYDTTTTPGVELTDVDLGAGVETNVGVSLSGCFDKVNPRR